MFSEDAVPDSESVPAHTYEYGPVPPVAADDHDTGWYTVTGFGVAEHVTVNTSTVKVSESVAVPFAPVQDTEYVVVFAGETSTEPSVSPSVEKPVPVHEVAFSEDHVRSAG